ncbi:threonine synthase [uncultured Brevundimonas sp.]|uniref:threonine synthase n=1 Tax=uncultured Brevundimonas sp. TaxID=213418 RepID=UPI0030EC6842|tara:strand:- start:54434 stop:55798 length:1365 start_codon:yes stop_codon:yes gene_type:complete
MKYISTRGHTPTVNFAEAMLSGLAPDGGLYVPEAWPAADAALARPGVPYAEVARSVLTTFVGKALPGGAVDVAVSRLVERFDHEAVTPLVQLDDDLWLLELFHGPTAAFKDLAMQLAASLMEAALDRTGSRLTLVTATSGDTGAAAVRAFAGAERIRLIVLHPEGRVSPVQRLQMTTVAADNITNLAVRGDFDDCQRLVKGLLTDETLRAQGPLSSVNSINWARLAGQIPYYVTAGAALAGPAPRFVVPTGNFGDAFAGWAARRMGANVGGLVAAVNSNDALARVLADGTYSRRTTVETYSVSMDVQAPSNFERLVFEATDRDPDRTRTLFETFAREGTVTLDDDLQARLRTEVSAETVSEVETRAEIAHAWSAYGQIICPHTAVALAAARRQDPAGGPVVALSTAHPAKFPAVVSGAVGFEPRRPSVLEGLEGCREYCRTVEPDLDAVLNAIG